LSLNYQAIIKQTHFKIQRNYFPPNKFSGKQSAWIKKSELFDAPYYLQNHKDVRESGMNPARHYLLHGGIERRNPSPGFESQFYLEQNPDVKNAGMNPLVHYIRYGKREGRAMLP